MDPLGLQGPWQWARGRAVVAGAFWEDRDAVLQLLVFLG